MRSRLTILGVLVAASVGCARPAPADDPGEPVPASAVADEPGEPVRAAAAYDGHLLCLYDGGAVGAWDLKTGEYAKDTGSRLARKGLTSLAAAGETLWSTDEAALYRWSAEAGAWVKAAGLGEPEERLAELVTVGKTPLLVYPSKVVDPVAGRTFPFPRLDKPGQRPPLGVLAACGTDATLWVGTGRGEWGGTLFGLDVVTGAWVHRYDALHYVTGITRTAPGEVVVSWSMSHFLAHTLVRVHRADATVKTEYPRLDGKYFQCVTYNARDDTLYGVESTDLVTIKDGKPSKVAKLNGRLFEREPNAIGVAPGVLALMPTGPQEVAVIPKRGRPWQLRNGELTPLRKP
jgi:hypothetical protein